MPAHALYYPEWKISDPVFLAESLLYWDRLACIVPFEGFREMPWHQDEQVRNLMAEAHERFVSALVPTEEQKSRVHERLSAFVDLDPPEWCRPENLRPQHRQVFSAFKFRQDTLDMLRERGWISQVPRSNSFQLQLIADAAADLMLGTLADECSSPTMPPVTDDPGSFSANCNLLLNELGAQHGITFRRRRSSRPPQTQDRDFSLLLMKIPHLRLDRERFQADTLRRILQARQDPELDARRKAFQRKVDDYLEGMRTAEAPERLLFAQEFQAELNADLEILNRELRRTGLETVARKEGVIAVIVGAVTGALGMSLGMVLGLTGDLLQFRQKRREALDRHWSSWIFSVAPNRLKVW